MDKNPFTFKLESVSFFGAKSGCFMFEDRVRVQPISGARQSDIDTQLHMLNLTYQLGFARGYKAAREGYEV